MLTLSLSIASPKTYPNEEKKIFTFPNETQLRKTLAEEKRNIPFCGLLKYAISDEQGDIEAGTKGSNWRDTTRVVLRTPVKKYPAYSARKLFHNQAVFKHQNYTACLTFCELQQIDLSAYKTLPWKGQEEQTIKTIQNIIRGAENKVVASYDLNEIHNNGYYNYVVLRGLLNTGKSSVDVSLLKYFLKKYKNVEIKISKDDSRDAIYIYSNKVLVAIAMPLNLK